MEGLEGRCRVDEYPGGGGKWQGPLTILQNIQAAAMVLVGWIGGV